ncbi:hypothetical protein [Terracidiphilus gabretensis]|uniref:hypothetical protein n=1 Tax=Terracidiphilus gabretensis TaxID=1577687 RepID=UPI00071B7EA5|nr:hypothetical protein [Terracidiphilus gabretensis]
MTLEDIDQTLPNGFHDATISEITHNYIHATLKFKIEVLVGLPDMPPQDRSRYRQAELLFRGVLFCIIESPDFESAFKHPGNYGSVSAEWNRKQYRKSWQKPSHLKHSAIPFSFLIGTPASMLQLLMWSYLGWINKCAYRWRRRRSPPCAQQLNTDPKLIRRLLLSLGMGEKVIRRPLVELIPAPQLIADQEAQSSQSHAR